MPVTINGTTGITTPALVNGTALAFRNKIINGNFDFWQRGTSLGSGTSLRFLADRFNNNSEGTTYSASQQSFSIGQADVANNPSYFHRTIVSSVAGNGNYCQLQHRIENVATLSGTTATLSFYAKSNANRNFSIDFSQYFGTGGTPSSVVFGIGVQKLSLTTSWQKFTLTVNIPSIIGKTIGTNNDNSLIVHFWFDAGSDFNSRTNSLGQQSGTFDIAQVQLEEGSVATPFENRPIGTELQLCKRYFEIWGSNHPLPLPQPYQSTLDRIPGIQWEVEKRAIPTITFSSLTLCFIGQIPGGGNITISNIEAATLSIWGAAYFAVTHSATSGINRYNVDAGQFVAVSSEL